MKTIDSFNGPHRFLSNFWSCCIAFEGHSYRTVEHAFQAAKTLDEDERRRIRNEPSAAGAKQRGKHATLREDWETIKVDVMRELLRLALYVIDTVEPDDCYESEKLMALTNEIQAVLKAGVTK